MITAAQWVPRGFAAPFPQKYTLDESEYERIAELAKLQLDDAEEDLQEAEADEAANGKDEEDGDDDAMVDATISSKEKTTDAKCVLCLNSRQKGMLTILQGRRR